MKAATGELNLTVVVFVAIGAIMLFFAAFSKTMFGDVSDSICCLASGGSFSNGVCQFANPKNQSSYRAKYFQFIHQITQTICITTFMRLSAYRC